MNRSSVILIYLFMTTTVWSQTSTLHFKKYSVEDGLSQSWVQSIIQDNLGFIWFGTDDGLNRFDGYSFKVYKHNPKNNSSLRNNSIKTLATDSKNRLWIGTLMGLCMFDRGQDQFYYDSLWPDAHVTDLECIHNTIYVATNTGIYTINTDNDIMSQLSVNNKAVLFDTTIFCLTIDKNENVWIGTISGLFVIPKGHKECIKITKKYLPDAYFLNDEINTLETDNQNRIWIGTETSGLCAITYKNNLGDISIKRYVHNRTNDESICHGSILALHADSQNKLWISIENGGLNIYDLNNFNTDQVEFKHYTYNPRDEKSLASNSIYAFCEDFQGNLWIGTYGGGISFYTRMAENFKHIKHINNVENSLVNNNVNVFFEFDNDIWIGTEGGLTRHNPGESTFVNFINHSGSDKSLSANAVWALNSFDTDNLWIGTWSGGINIYNKRTKAFSDLIRFRIPGENIFSIYKDSKGIIWVGTMGGGLTMIDEQNGISKTYVEDPQNPDAITNNWVRCIYETREGKLWLSTTESVEIFNRETETFTHFFPDIKDTASISGSGAYVIYEDSRNNLWFGTQAGLNYYNKSNSTFIYYQEEDGLPNNSVKGILEDAHGNLWLSTNKGISKMINGIWLPENPSFENFDVTDGLQGNEFNRRAAFKDKKGWMYFGGTNGFNVFHPDSIVKNKFIPPVVLTEFLLFNKPVDFKAKNAPLKTHISVAEEIRLKYNQNVFSIEFAALNFVNSNKNSYKYKLVGFDKNWNEVGTQKVANYTNIKPGEYTFVVKASNNDGIWNKTGKSIKIKIFPPWYRTILAYVLYAVFIISLFITFRYLILTRAMLKHEIEVKQIEREKLDEVHRLKTRFFTNISHEFRTPLTLIISPLDKILSKYSFTDNLKNEIRVILNNARRMMRLINQFLDISKIEAGYLKMQVHEGDLAKYIQTIAELFSYQAEEKSIEYKLDFNKNSYNAWFDSDKIEKILYNFLSNAIKFTPAGGKVELKVQFNDSTDKDIQLRDTVEFWIKDTGIGIKEEEKEYIFDRFYQADNSKASKYSGTGIGLSLASGLINKYGGKLEVDSQYGSGTGFYFRLPCARENFNSNSVIVRTEEEYLGKLQDVYSEPSKNVDDLDILSADIEEQSVLPVLLIIEDNEELRSYISSHFKETFKVLEAPDGKEGYQMALERNPDIIISDIMMPEMDGIEVTRLLKTDENTSHIPIIILTAKTSDEVQIEGLETGADAFLAKPFNITVLDARVKNLLDSRKKLKKSFSQNIQIEPTEISVTSVDASFIQKAISLVDKNIANPDFNVYSLSKEMGVSRALLHRKLIALTDLPPSGFIKALRLKRGAYLLVEGQKTVSEVIYEVGIKSRSYFTKSFKEMFGMSPTEYVENEKNKRKEGDEKKENY